MYPDVLAGQDNISIRESSVCLLTPMNGRRIFYTRLWVGLLSANHILGPVVLVVFPFGDCKVCLQGFLGHCTNSGQGWSVVWLFSWGEAAAGFRERNISGSFSFPQIHENCRKNNWTKRYFPTTLGTLLRLHLHDRAFHFPPSDTQQERDIIVSRIFPIQWNLSGLIK